MNACVVSWSLVRQWRRSFRRFKGTDVRFWYRSCQGMISGSHPPWNVPHFKSSVCKCSILDAHDEDRRTADHYCPVIHVLYAHAVFSGWARWCSLANIGMTFKMRSPAPESKTVEYHFNACCACTMYASNLFFWFFWRIATQLFLGSLRQLTQRQEHWSVAFASK